MLKHVNHLSFMMGDSCYCLRDLLDELMQVDMQHLLKHLILDYSSTFFVKTYGCELKSEFSILFYILSYVCSLNIPILLTLLCSKYAFHDEHFQKEFQSFQGRK